MNVLRYKGAEFPSNQPIVDGRLLKLKSGTVCHWPENSPHVRRRRVPIRAVLLHHTAGEGNATAIYKTLSRRKLSVHFTIDRSGVVVQHADIDLVTYHAGSANDYSVGIEIANRGVAPCMAHAPREVYQDSVRGHARNFLKFYPQQVEAARVLTRDLCELLGIPYQFPMDSTGRVSRVTHDRAFLSQWTGLLGHLHVSDRKVDPSPHLMDELAK